jgi:hypothetical protein
MRRHVLLAIAVSFPFITTGALAALGHESGGRIGAATVYVRFNSRGGGIDRRAHDEIEALVEAHDHEGQVAERNERVWGREGERDLCVRLRGTGKVRPPALRAALSEEISRVVRLGDSWPGAVQSMVTDGTCDEWPARYVGIDGGAYLQDFLPSADLVSLNCSGALPGSDAYHIKLKLYELLDRDNHARVRYALLQSSRSARYRTLEGRIGQTAATLDSGAVELRWTSGDFVLTATPTFALDAHGSEGYRGTIAIGGHEFPVTCASSRQYGVK